MVGIWVLILITFCGIILSINNNTRVIKRAAMLKMLDDDENLKNLYAIEGMQIVSWNMNKIISRYEKVVVSKNYDKYKATADELLNENIITKEEYEHICRSLKYNLPITNK